MAVVNLNSDIYRDELAGGQVPDAAKANARLFTITGTVSNGATDSQGSTYKLCELPSNCLLDESTAFDVQNDGYAQIEIGTLTDPTALVNVAKAAGNPVNPKGFGDANHGKALWEMLGLAADPGGMIAIYKHGAAAGAAAAGSMPFRISYLA